MDSRIALAQEQWCIFDPEPIPGDASLRQYLRVHHPELGTAILVLYPDVDPDDETYFEYRALHIYLQPLVRVPLLYECDDGLRIMLLEDLGDESLESRLVDHPEEELVWARRIGRILATFAGPLTLGAPPHSFFMARSFDLAKFNFEWDFCKSHFFGAFLKKDPPAWLDRFMNEVHQRLAGRSVFFSHRDFHVRNLMIHRDFLATIDFQDARSGPATYDLASILFDSYWDWSAQAAQALIQELKEEIRWSEGELKEELRLTAIQRNLKALGTFGFQITHRRKSRYASAIPRALRHLRNHFTSLSHQEGVLAVEHWMRLSESRMLRPFGDEGAAEGLLL